MDIFPKPGEKALSVLIPFATTYLCQSGFSALLSIKTKSRNDLNAQADMRVAISNKVPRFEKLLSNKQEQLERNENNFMVLNETGNLKNNI